MVVTPGGCYGSAHHHPHHHHCGGVRVSCPVSSHHWLILFGEPLEGAVLVGVVGGVGGPALPDDVEPGAGEDAYRVRMVVAAGAGAVVQVGCPGVGVAAVAGEVADGVAQLFVYGPAERDDLDFAGLAGGGCGAGQARESGVGNRPRASPISASSRAARTVPALGRAAKTGLSGCASNAWVICCLRAWICAVIVVRVAR